MENHRFIFGRIRALRKVAHGSFTFWLVGNLVFLLFDARVLFSFCMSGILLHATDVRRVLNAHARVRLILVFEGFYTWAPSHAC